MVAGSACAGFIRFSMDCASILIIVWWINNEMMGKITLLYGYTLICGRNNH
jgi:hypothetical protein